MAACSPNWTFNGNISEVKNALTIHSQDTMELTVFWSSSEVFSAKEKGSSNASRLLKTRL